MVGKPTPGPWTVESPKIRHTEATIEAPYGEKPGHLMIAHVDCVDGFLGSSEANAHLIAAAPDLYATLLDLRHALGYIGFGTDSDPVNGSEAVDLINEWLPRISAAIAKAGKDQV